MKTVIQLFLFTLVLLFIFAGCTKKDDDNTPPEVVSLAIQEKLDEIEVPANLANSQSIYALQVNTYVSLIKGIASYFLFFDPIDDAEYNDGTYFWIYGGQSVWMEYSETSSSYVYKMDVDFGNGMGRTNYITSQQDKDGTSGWLKIYDFTDEVDGDFIYEYNWEIETDGSVKVSFNNMDDTDVLELGANPDDSGYIKSYTNNVLMYEMVWNSDGTGYINEYDESGNKIVEQSWTLEDL